MKSENRFDIPTEPTRPIPVDCVVGETVRRVRILTEADWDAIPTAERPAPAEHFPGLGWVVAEGRRKP